MPPEKASKHRLRKSAKAFRKPLQWQVDSDYLDKLSPADREWMLRFQEAEYGGNGHLMHDDQDECRRLWVQQKKQQRDALPFARYVESGVPDGMTDSPEDALISAIDHQAATEKAAREEKRLAGVAARRKKRKAKEKRAERRKQAKRLLAEQAQAGRGKDGHDGLDQDRQPVGDSDHSPGHAD